MKKPSFGIKKAADQGYDAAQFNLGLMYFKGQGAPQNNKEAAFWFQKAAEQGFKTAQRNLCLIYATGNAQWCTCKLHKGL
ncbi:tetratricopeptide repeat protein [Dethiosulfatarculus sandiegensis]|uniref:tetratricopeptide repeat protein n=1 Tax=Dethiosulfatarculus sandiegensis TaxID=1429043 RepID=UPI0012E13157